MYIGTWVVIFMITIGLVAVGGLLHLEHLNRKGGTHAHH
jgi:hypothetical protein